MTQCDWWFDTDVVLYPSSLVQASLLKAAAALRAFVEPNILSVYSPCNTRCTCYLQDVMAEYIYVCARRPRVMYRRPSQRGALIFCFLGNISYRHLSLVLKVCSCSIHAYTYCIGWGAWKAHWSTNKLSEGLLEAGEKCVLNIKDTCASVIVKCGGDTRVVLGVSWPD